MNLKKSFIFGLISSLFLILNYIFEGGTNFAIYFSESTGIIQFLEVTSYTLQTVLTPAGGRIISIISFVFEIIFVIYVGKSLKGMFLKTFSAFFIIATFANLVYNIIAALGTNNFIAEAAPLAESMKNFCQILYVFCALFFHWAYLATLLNGRGTKIVRLGAFFLLVLGYSNQAVSILSDFGFSLAAEFTAMTDAFGNIFLALGFAIFVPIAILGFIAPDRYAAATIKDKERIVVL